MDSSDRSKYFHGLRILVTGRTENEKPFPDLASDNFRCHWNKMIWLELQAWQNNRSVGDQDTWLVEKRQSFIPNLINTIQDYHFEGNLQENFPQEDISHQHVSSEFEFFLRRSVSRLSDSYLENHRKASQEVYEMLEKVSYAELLFSCSQSVGLGFPIYQNPNFQNKLKSLCIWFNISTELVHCFSTILRMLGFPHDQYQFSCINEDICNYLPSKSVILAPLKLPATIDEIMDAIGKMTESSLRQYKVQEILLLLLKRFLGCMVKSHEIVEKFEKKTCYQPELSEKFHQCCSTTFNQWQSLVKDIHEFYPTLNFDLHHESSIEIVEFHGLPDIQPLHAFVLDIIFAIVGKCLVIRLEQAQACRQHCGSRTSLLTVQQVVCECKEVIHCSLLIHSIHQMFRIIPVQVDRKCPTKAPFKRDLLYLFETYMEFVELWILAQLTGLPHAPRAFIENLTTEWNFAKMISVKIDVMSYVPCACKMIEVCRKVFEATKNFLETASLAIIQSKIDEDTLFEAQKFGKEIKSPTSPQAGVLWFHRQRSESPHIARRHSSIFDVDDRPVLHFSKSAPLLNVDPVDFNRRYVFELGRAVRDLFEEVQERSGNAISFGKCLRKDLESSVGFSFIRETKSHHKKRKLTCSYCGLLKTMEKNGFTKVDISWKSNYQLSAGFHPENFMLFAFESSIKSKLNNVQSPLSFKSNAEKLNLLKQLVSCCNILLAAENSDFICSYSFLVVRENQHSMIKKHNETPQCSGKTTKHAACCRIKPWSGPTVCLDEADLLEIDMDVCDLLCKDLSIPHDVMLLSQNGIDMGRKRRNILKLFGKYIEVSIPQTGPHQKVQSSMEQLNQTVLEYSQLLTQQIDVMSRLLCNQAEGDISFHEGEDLLPEISRIVQKNFNIGFECLKEATKLLCGHHRISMERIQLTYMKSWMNYVMECLPRGTGKKPRWANSGLHFLANLNLDLIKGLSNEEYGDFKLLIQNFLDHLIGSQPHKAKTQSVRECPDATIYRSLSSHSSKDEKGSGNTDTHNLSQDPDIDLDDDFNMLPIEKMRFAIRDMDLEIDEKRLDEGKIGQVVETPRNPSLEQITLRSIDFQWQRGNQIGAGSFGKVYTCVNLTSGKIVAMKEISFQANDEHQMKEALDEITNFEGITHPNLVKYYGIELHRDQLYLFMEYCDAGTLEELCKIGLSEALIQLYTVQLVTAVSILHQNGVVHRDIKGSNIFLTSNGLLKLGDFGSAVRLMNRTQTLGGEIVAHRGTTAAYTAPEVFNSVENRGYGRAADVWSVGCVVIEMTTGKRPWHDHEPFQILYKVGMGSKPTIPANISEDGKSFILHCLEEDPSRRWNIQSLQSHPFVKVALPDYSKTKV
ncbi:mitogen-activated protein kinase kinase kinase 4-like isoform X2 [Clavelina lepadiformis]|uniref:Protein kinase domain-containing protein n=1 Tax=Clavelina lepadiformis TaxID=159417 RepID=A0ABP0F8P7_CLALP